MFAAAFIPLIGVKGAADASMETLVAKAHDGTVWDPEKSTAFIPCDCEGDILAAVAVQVWGQKETAQVTFPTNSEVVRKDGKAVGILVGFQEIK